MDRTLTLTAGAETLVLRNNLLAEHGLVDLVGMFGSPGMAHEITDRVGDGVFVGPRRWKGREITVSGETQAADGDEDRMRDWLVGFLPRVTRLDETAGGRTRGCAVTLDGMVQVSMEPARLVDWQAPYIAADPYLYGPAVSFTLTPANTGGGLVYPLTYPWTYGASTGVDTVAITNEGTAPAWPTFTVTGDFPSGFRIVLGGHVVEYPYATFPQSPVTVDMAGHLWVGGVDMQARLTVRDWSSIAAGATENAQFIPIQTGTGQCVVTVSDTYL